MTNDDILKVARENQLISGPATSGIYVGALITFANRIAAMQRDLDAGIVEDWDSDSADPREVAAAIREQSDE